MALCLTVGPTQKQNPDTLLWSKTIKMSSERNRIRLYWYIRSNIFIA